MDIESTVIQRRKNVHFCQRSSQSFGAGADAYEDPNKEKRLWEEAEKRFGKELLSEAIEHRDDTEENNPDPSPELIDAIQTVNDIIDQGYETEQRNELYHDVFRFRLLRVYNRLVDELYPPYQS